MFHIRISLLRYSDFLRGLPASEILTQDSAALSDASTFSPADRLRLIYEFVTSTPNDGGLGVVPGSTEWTRVESVLALHDREFNDMWLRSWTRRQVGFGIGKTELDKIKDQVRPDFSSMTYSTTYSLVSSSENLLLFISPSSHPTAHLCSMSPP